MATGATETAVQPRWLTRGVGSVGLASFLSDSGHEIATSVFPSFVTHTLGGSAGALGLIEGVSDGLAGVAKLAGGSAANDERRRRSIAAGGYVLTGLATAAIGVAGTVWQAGVLRAVGWIARGARGPAKNALLASLAPPEAYGRAFGYERTMDHLGAVVGPLAAAGLVAAIGIRHTIYLSVLPGVLAALAIVVAAREAALHGGYVRRRVNLELASLREAGILRALAPVTLFELGNCAATLLILRATGLLDLGRSASSAATIAVLLFAAHNFVGSALSFPAGRSVDRRGPAAVFAAAVSLFGLAYAGFAFASNSWPVLLGLFALAGAAMGLADTAESALVARLLPDELRGSGFGLLGGVQSLGDFVSSAGVGLVWTAVSPTAAFLVAAGWMLLSLVATVPAVRAAA
ncbi:MAG TPA: MFS transporter [Gaiellaceae bacterium]|nr:MFS transporter [Gaiellaceae bacterium]